MPARTIAVLFLCITLTCSIEARAQDAAFVSLFDGKTWTGWEGDRDLFRIEDDALVAGTLDAPIAANAFLCTTEEYDDFELRLSTRILGPGDNGGVQFRSRRVPDQHEVSGYQADMGSVSRAWFYDVIGIEDKASTDEPAPVWGAIYDETRRNRYLAWSLPAEVAAVLHPNDWNDLVVRAEGPRIQIWVNDLRTVDYTELSHIPRSGLICLQVHSGAPTEIWHKDLRLLDLKGDE